MCRPYLRKSCVAGCRKLLDSSNVARNKDGQILGLDGTGICKECFEKGGSNESGYIVDGNRRQRETLY
jgi:hypothetical protein